MAKTNGRAGPVIAHPVLPSSETADFIVGGVTIQVPALTLYVIERVKTPLQALGPEISWIDYACFVCQIIAEALQETRPDLTAEVLTKACSMTEAVAKALEFNNYLDVSGFRSAGEVQAVMESPGTSTPMPSPPNSLPRESAEETSTG